MARARIACVFEVVVPDEVEDLESWADEFAFELADLDNRVEICEGAWVNALAARVWGSSLGVLETSG